MPPRPPAESRSETESVASSEVKVVPRLGIVVPCFNEEEVLPETARRLAAVLAELVS